MNDITAISFELEKIKFKGWFTKTVSCYPVVLSDAFFGNLSLNNCKWNCSEIRQAELVAAMGKTD